MAERVRLWLQEDVLAALTAMRERTGKPIAVIVDKAVRAHVDPAVALEAIGSETVLAWLAEKCGFPGWKWTGMELRRPIPPPPRPPRADLQSADD